MSRRLIVVLCGDGQVTARDVGGNLQNPISGV